MSSEVAPQVPTRPLPRRGRIWVVLMLALGLFALGYFIVTVSTKKAGSDVVHVAGISEAQEIFGGVPQEGDRLGSSDAPVTVQLFNDIQCSNCSEDFLAAIPTLAEKYARAGSVKFLYRHYSNSESPQELGFYGAEAAAAQGYGWQYIYLFFRNQDEAERFGVNQDFLDSIAGSVEELNFPEWQEYLEKEGGSNGAISKVLEGDEELGRNLGIRYGQAAIVTGPGGTRTIQDGARLGQMERAIEAVQ
ncbi:MAG TPA: thioredoxin domain-containing protein [Solirubrobacterales bacterium]|nr:thioredoxin domain-containing protein [Solirubrobacterales bacterium]